jgi:CRP-like cAMP-binding protein
MLIDQADLLWGMDKLFVKEFMGITTTVQFEKGDIVFREADPAGHFYTLIEGRVRLFVGEPPREVYAIDHAGEAFGWSSLVDRNYYSAGAECLEPTRCLKIDRKKLETLLQQHLESGFMFYKKLAGILGHRLVECYKLMFETAAYGQPPAPGAIV